MPSLEVDDSAASKAGGPSLTGKVSMFAKCFKKTTGSGGSARSRRGSLVSEFGDVCKISLLLSWGRKQKIPQNDWNLIAMRLSSKTVSDVTCDMYHSSMGRVLSINDIWVTRKKIVHQIEIGSWCVRPTSGWKRPIIFLDLSLRGCVLGTTPPFFSSQYANFLGVWGGS